MVSTTSRVLLAVGIAGILLAASPRASAQGEAEKKQALALQSEGLRLMQKGDNQGALAKFEEAFRLVSSPKILFNMGKAHLALGDEVKAVDDFERFLDEAPFAPKESRDEAQRRVESLRLKLAYIEIQTDDVGSMISVDGRLVGTAPLARPVVVMPGSHEVRVEKPEMSTDARQVAPIAGQKLRVVVKLAPAMRMPAPVAATPMAPAPGGGPPYAVSGPAPTAPGAASAVVVTSAPSADAHARHLRITGIALGASGAVVTIIGVGFGLAAKSDGEANSKPGATFSASTYDAGHRAQTLQYVGYGLGVGLIAAGVTTWVLGNRGHEPAPTTPVVSFVPASGGGLALAALRF